MTNGYVRKDLNRESNFFANAEGQEHMLMADGTAMNATAFRDAHQTTKFTPEELGMDISASPFYDPAEQEYSGAVAVESDSQTMAALPLAKSSESFSLKAPVLPTMNVFNQWVSTNAGFILIGSLAIFGIYHFGYQRGRNHAA
jgi:hypothetical protein